MRTPIVRWTAAVVLGLLSVAVSYGQTPTTRPSVFTHDGLTVTIPAEGGRLDAFEPVEGVDDTYRCTIRTWEKKLSSGGPQFSFLLRSPTARRVTLRFRYIMGDGKRWWGSVRYYMLRRPGKPYERHVMGRDQTAGVAVDATGVEIVRSAPFTLAEFEKRLKKWSKVAGVKISAIGKSVAGRPIRRIVFGGTARRRPPTFWILSRQHPAEPSGQHMAAAVIDTLLSDDPKMRSLRQRVRFSCVPLINPDGVADMLWRFNKNGADLNRDWKNATQPEIRAVRAVLEADLKAGLPPAAMIDFHSTYSTFWYVPSKRALAGPAAAFFPALIANANRRMGPRFTAGLKPAFSRRIGNTSGSYFVGRFAIPAATAEMAYHALPAESRAYGRAIAKALAEVPVPLPQPASAPATRPAAAG